MDEINNKEEFLTIIEELLTRTLEIPKLDTKVTMNTKLVDSVGDNSIGLSSIDYVDFLVMVETKFDVVYDFDVTFYTVSDIYNYILEYKEAKNEQ